MKHLSKRLTAIVIILMFSIGLMLSSSVISAGGKKATQVALDAAITDLQSQINEIPLITPIYELGGTGPAGGFIFFVDSSGQHGLEAAPEDQGTGIRWHNGTDTDTEAHGDGVGAGEMNTMLIIANQGSDSDSYAAGLCANLVIYYAGVYYGDWYLPSEEELNLMWENLADSDGDGVNSGLGDFAEEYYWSSTERNSANAWDMNFAHGSQNTYYKDTLLRVRAVRAF